MTSRRSFLSGVLAAGVAPSGARGAIDAVRVGRTLDAAVGAATARADALLRRLGLASGPVAGRIAALMADGRWLYPDDDTGRDQAVADMNARLAALRPRLPRALGDLPIPPAEVRRMSADDAAKGRAGYRDAAAGAYYVDLAHIRARPAWTLPSVAFHEVVPGHLLQLSLQAAAGADPPRPPAAFEGWAIYAEALAARLGAYADDPLGEIGFLHWRLFRLARAAADVGLHAHGWSRDRALAAMRRIQGPAVAFVTPEADVDRIATHPGQTAAEALAALRLERLRPADEARWPSFHRAVLIDGPWPQAARR
ncbi:MAG TPA: DUF885 family protein [Caulobacteraceae bacterium]|nr:DUF885 family protein [Caulobacteraceae bacterium]